MGLMYGGGVATLCPSAGLKLQGSGIRLVVSSIRSQCLDLAHFRADFDPIVQKTLLAAVPGQFPCLLDEGSYSRLRDGMRLGPDGPKHHHPKISQKKTSPPSGQNG